MRKRLDTERRSITHSVKIGTCNVVITAGEYDSGQLGEIFIQIAKQGDELRAYDIIATAISIGLQSGVPLKTFVDKFKHVQMEPSGFTNNEKIPIAKSVIDYVARWLEMKYLNPTKPNK